MDRRDFLKSAAGSDFMVDVLKSLDFEFTDRPSAIDSASPSAKSIALLQQ